MLNSFTLASRRGLGDPPNSATSQQQGNDCPESC